MKPIDQAFTDHCRQLVSEFLKENQKLLPPNIIVFTDEIPTSGNLDPIIEKYTNELIRRCIQFALALGDEKNLDPDILATTALIAYYNQQADPDLPPVPVNSDMLKLSADLLFDHIKTRWHRTKLADRAQTIADETDDYFD